MKSSLIISCNNIVLQLHITNLICKLFQGRNRQKHLKNSIILSMHWLQWMAKASPLVMSVQLYSGSLLSVSVQCYFQTSVWFCIWRWIYICGGDSLLYSYYILLTSPFIYHCCSLICKDYVDMLNCLSLTSLTKTVVTNLNHFVPTHFFIVSTTWILLYFFVLM